MSVHDENEKTIEKIPLKFNGKIISELSEKIPSYIVALEELIKNSYDAGALTCEVTLNTQQRILTVVDNGKGMDRDQIASLFHLGESTKTYGERKDERYVQGSKGIGFLAVYKFGYRVEWTTKAKDCPGYHFEMQLDEITDVHDLSKYAIPVEEKSDASRGTKVLISLTDESATALNDFFSDDTHFKRILGLFTDENFIILFNFNGKQGSSKDLLQIDKNAPDRQLVSVRYDSTVHSQQIEYFVDGIKIKKAAFPIAGIGFSIKIDLLFFHLNAHAKKQIDCRFRNSYNDLTPLIYINDNFFNNFTLFDPQILRTVKTSQVAAQMIGFVKIYCSSKDFGFNSDRTSLIQNGLTDKIVNTLKELNKNIQQTVSSFRTYLRPNANNAIVGGVTTYSRAEANANKSFFQSKISDDVPFKDKIVIRKEPLHVRYLLGKKQLAVLSCENPPRSFPIAEEELQAARFKFKGDNGIVSIAIPTTCQIKLTDYIDKATDSHGEPIPFDQIDISVNGELSETKIISAPEDSCSKTIRYHYHDSNTGDLQAELQLDFKAKAKPIIGNKLPEPLLSLPGSQSYEISFKPVVSKLINQINEVSNFGNQYLEIIACSLRALFDISIYALHDGKGEELKSLLAQKSKLEEKVGAIIKMVHEKSCIRTEIDNASGIGYKNLGNILIESNFETAIHEANLGAHQSTTHITETEIKDLAKKASYFLVIADVLWKNPELTKDVMKK